MCRLNKLNALAAAFLVMCVNSCKGETSPHCSLNNFLNTWNTTHHMQYTKEPVNREYAVMDQFKSLHCCAKGYRSIEW